MSWFNDLMALALTMPPAALTLLVFVSAWLEYVFPPYFGDSMMLFGFFLAGQGVVSPASVFVAAIAGSLLGSVVAFLVGERYGTQVFASLARGRWSKRFDLERLRTMLADNGEAILVINRFVPFLRNFMIYGAGAFRLRMVPSLLANAISVTAFVSMLMALGMMAAGSWEELRVTFSQLYGALGSAMAVVLVLWLAVTWRQPRSEPHMD